MNTKNLTLLFLICLVSTFFAQGQNKNPFRSIGKQGTILTLSNGKYDELIGKDSLERIGSVIMNRFSKKIIAFLNAEQLAKTNNFSFNQTRFLSVDPLTKKFAELSPYQYASNRPIDGKDLDGLEWQSTGKYFNSVTGKYQIDYKVTLSLANDKNVLDLSKNTAKLSSIEKFAEQTLSKLDAKGTAQDPIINTNIIFTDKEGPFKVAFFHAESISSVDPKTKETKVIKNETFAGRTNVGESQKNLVEIPLTNTFIIYQPGTPTFRTTTAPGSDLDIARSFSHELGHTAGLRHPWDPKASILDVVNVLGLLPSGNPALILNNLMNSPGNPLEFLNPDKQNMKQGAELTKSQRELIEETVQEQQTKKN
jgi:hypothetical protein